MPDYEKIIPADHCILRQHERGISRQQILTVIEDPTNELPTQRKGRRKFWKRVDGSRLTVIVKEVKNGKDAIIITAYWSD